MPEQDREQSATALFDLVVSQRITATIFVAARFGIADVLAAGPRSASDVAKEINAHERSVRRLLRALVAAGICRQPEGNLFELTAIGMHLAAGAELSLKAYVLFEGGMLSREWGELFESVRTGKAGWEMAGAKDRFSLLANDSDSAKIFHDAMASVTSLVMPAVLTAYDFGDIACLMDVGGGLGEMLSAILQAYPSMRGVVFDLAICEPGAKRRLAEAGVDDRSEFIVGDFFESVPGGADAICMKSIIHDWNDERCLVILRNCRRALPPSGRVILIERVISDTLESSPDDLSNTLADLNMLRGPGGAERTEREYRELLLAGGFASVRIISAGRFSLIEARAE